MKSVSWLLTALPDNFTEPNQDLDMNTSWIVIQFPEIEWAKMNYPSDIISGYNVLCDVNQIGHGFQLNNRDELLEADFNFSHGASVVGLLKILWIAAQLAFAFYSVPKISVELISKWIAPDASAGKPIGESKDAFLEEAGPLLKQVALPPAENKVTKDYMKARMLLPAQVGGVNLPWGVGIQTTIFFAQLVAGLIKTWYSIFFQRNCLWLLSDQDHFMLTFRREMFLVEFANQCRFCVTFLALGSMLGWDEFGKIRKPSWVQHPNKHPELDKMIDAANILRNWVLPITALVSALPFIPCIVALFSPGMIIAWAALKWQGRIRSAPGDLGEPLLQHHAEDAMRMRNSLLVMVTSSFASALLASEAMLQFMNVGQTYICSFSKLSLLHINVQRFQFGDVAGFIVLIMAVALFMSLILFLAARRARKSGKDQDFVMNALRQFHHQLFLVRSHHDMDEQGRSQVLRMHMAIYGQRVVSDLELNGLEGTPTRNDRRFHLAMSTPKKEDAMDLWGEVAKLTSPTQISHTEELAKVGITLALLAAEGQVPTDVAKKLGGKWAVALMHCGFTPHMLIDYFDREEDKEVVRAWVKHPQDAPELCKKSKLFWLAVLSQNPVGLQHMPDNILDNTDVLSFVAMYIGSNQYKVENLSEEARPRVLGALLAGVAGRALPEQQKIRAAVKYLAPFVSELTRTGAEAMSMRMNVLAAVRLVGQTVKFVHESLQQDVEVAVAAAVSAGTDILVEGSKVRGFDHRGNLSKWVRGYTLPEAARRRVLRGLLLAPEAVHALPEDAQQQVKSAVEMLSKKVVYDENATECAALAEKERAIAAVQCFVQAVKYIPRSMQGDVDVVVAAAARLGRNILLFAGTHKRPKLPTGHWPHLLGALLQAGVVIQQLPKHEQHNVNAAVKKLMETDMGTAMLRVLKEKTSALVAMKADGSALLHLPNSLQEDPEVAVAAAAEAGGNVVQFSAGRMRQLGCRVYQALQQAEDAIKVLQEDEQSKVREAQDSLGSARWHESSPRRSPRSPCSSSSCGSGKTSSSKSSWVTR